MCPQADDYLQSAIRHQRIGNMDRALAELVTAVARARDPDVRATAMTWQSNVLRAQCQWDAAIATAHQARDIARKAGLETRAAEAWIAEANVHLARGEFEAALPVFHALLDGTSDPRIRGVALQNIGNIRAQCGMLQQAEVAFARSFAWFERAGYLLGQAITRNNQGRARLDGGDAAGAVPILSSALELARRSEDGELIASTLINLGEALLATDPVRAEELVCSALGHCHTSGNVLAQLDCLRLLGDITAGRGDAAHARTFYERGLALGRQVRARVEVESLERRLRELNDFPASTARTAARTTPG